MRRRVFIRTIACVFQYRYNRQVNLQGNVNSNGSDADANTNSSSDGNANSNSTSQSSSLTLRSLDVTRGLGRSRLSITWSGSGLINCSGSRSGMTASVLRHCHAAKSADKANHDHCCQKLLHNVCLLYWLGWVNQTIKLNKNQT